MVMKHMLKFLLPVLLLGSISLAAQEPVTNPPQAPATTVVDPGAKLHISGNLEICKGSETILKAEGDFESFTWNFGGVTGRYLKVKEAGVYEVTAKTKGGCTFIASVTVRYRPCPV